MDSHGFGAVGAVSNIKNPIKISLSLLDAQHEGTLSLGRIVPCMLVGEGARKWAQEHDIEELDEELMKTEPMIKSHKFYKKKLDTLELENNNQLNSNGKRNKNLKENQIYDKQQIKAKDETRSLDTVGAVVLDQ